MNRTTEQERAALAGAKRTLVGIVEDIADGVPGVYVSTFEATPATRADRRCPSDPS